MRDDDISALYCCLLHSYGHITLYNALMDCSNILQFESALLQGDNRLIDLFNWDN